MGAHTSERKKSLLRRVCDLELRVKDLKSFLLRVWGLESRDEGLGLRVRGLPKHAPHDKPKPNPSPLVPYRQHPQSLHALPHKPRGKKTPSTKPYTSFSPAAGIVSLSICSVTNPECPLQFLGGRSSVKWSRNLSPCLACGGFRVSPFGARVSNHVHANFMGRCVYLWIDTSIYGDFDLEPLEHLADQDSLRLFMDRRVHLRGL